MIVRVSYICLYICVCFLLKCWMDIQDFEILSRPVESNSCLTISIREANFFVKQTLVCVLEFKLSSLNHFYHFIFSAFSSSNQAVVCL